MIKNKDKEVLWIFGLHAEDMPKKNRKKEVVCVLCDRKMFLTDHGTKFIEKEKPEEDINTKYVSSSCITRANTFLLTDMISHVVGDIRLMSHSSEVKN